MQQRMGESSRWTCLNSFGCSTDKANRLRLAALSVAGMNNQGRKKNSAEKSGKVRSRARYLSRGKLILLL